MRNGNLLLAGLVALAASELSAAPAIGTDDFSYPDAVLDGNNGGTGWDMGGTGKNAWSWSYSNSAQVTGGVAHTWDGGSLRNYGASIMATGVVYFGVDMKFGADAVVANRYGGISSYDFGSERIKFGKTWSNTTFSLDGYGEHSTGIPIVADQFYRVVGSIQWDTAGGQGLLKMWVNPDAADFDAALGQGASTSADLVVDYGNTGNWNTGIRLASGGSNGYAPMWYDNLVVATSFDVAAAVPEPASLAAAGLASMLLVRRRRA
jgi:hypothetical protein